MIIRVIPLDPPNREFPGSNKGSYWTAYSKLSREGKANRLGQQNGALTRDEHTGEYFTITLLPLMIDLRNGVDLQRVKLTLKVGPD